MLQSLKLVILVIWALLAREIRSKVMDAGLISIFSPLLFQLAIWHIVYYLLHKQSLLGMSISLFIAVSYIPFWLAEKIAIDSASIFPITKASLSFKQVKIFDAVIANALSWLISVILVYLVMLIILKVMDDKFDIFNWFYLFYAVILAFIVGLSIGFAASVLGVFVKLPYLWVMLIFRLIYFISGIFFPISILPLTIQNILVWNPMLQIVEISRYAFLPIELDGQINLWYPSVWALCLLFIGLLIYYANKDVFLRKAFE